MSPNETTIVAVQWSIYSCNRKSWILRNQTEAKPRKKKSTQLLKVTTFAICLVIVCIVKRILSVECWHYKGKYKVGIEKSRSSIKLNKNMIDKKVLTYWNVFFPASFGDELSYVCPQNHIRKKEKTLTKNQ